MDFLDQMQSPHMHVEMIQYIITHFLILSNNTSNYPVSQNGLPHRKNFLIR